MKKLLLVALLMATSLNINAQTKEPEAPQLEFALQLKVTLGEAFGIDNTQHGRRTVAGSVRVGTVKVLLVEVPDGGVVRKRPEALAGKCVVSDQNRRPGATASHRIQRHVGIFHFIDRRGD